MKYHLLAPLAKMLESKRHELEETSVWDDCFEGKEKELEIACDVFDGLITNSLEAGDITNHEFNLLVLTAFYDYPDGLKPDPEFEI